MKKYCIFVFILGVLFISKLGFANLLMEQSRVRLTVTPGETVVDSVTLHNRGEEDISIKVYWNDFRYLEPYYGKKEFHPAGTTKDSLADWVILSPQHFFLPAGSQQDVQYTIKVPKEAEGGHYGVLFFERGSGDGDGNTGVNIITRMGSLFFIESVNSERIAHVQDFHVTLPSSIKGTFVNDGDVSLFSKGVYFIMDKEGSVVERGEVKKIYVPRDKQADFVMDVGSEIKQGLYTIVLTFDLGQDDFVVQEIDFRKSDKGLMSIVDVRD